MAAVSAFGQVTGQLNGTVVDASGSGLPNASVHVFLAGGAKSILDTKTNGSGYFSITALRPDTYDVSVESSGFATAHVNRVAVAPGVVVDLPAIRVELAGTAQTVEVTANAAGVQLTTPEVSSTLTAQQLQNLPVFDKQVLAPLISQPGVTGSRTVTTINGMRPSFTNVTLDGLNLQDSVRTNALDFQPNRLTSNEIAEMTISTSNVDSSVAGNVASVAMSTPSGNNDYHGKAYWDNRNSYLAANDWFSNQAGIARPQLNQNQLGGSVSGPIKKDKLLFFGNYEALRRRAGTPRTLTVLTPTARQGIFQYRTAAGVQQFDILKAANVTADPFIQSLLAQVPANGNTNTAGDGLNTTGYTFNARNNTDRDNVLGKLDYYLTTKQTLSVSYLWNREIVDRPDMTGSGTFYTSVPPIFNDNANLFMAFAWRWSPTANFTNELRGGFDRQTGAFSNRADVPKYYITNTAFNPPVSQNPTEVRKTNNNLVQDNANWVRGNHNIAFGGQFAPVTTTDNITQNVYPSYAVGTSTANGFGFTQTSIPGASSTDITRANALLVTLAGILNTGAETFNITSRTSGYVSGAPSATQLSLNNLAFYARDNWRIRPNLTLTLGLRWEYFGPVDTGKGLLIEPDASNGNAVQALLSNATLNFVPNPLYKRDLNNFAPNVGFAWNVFGNGKTSLRGGYAISFANDNLINDIPNTINNGNNNGLSTAQTVANLKGFANSAPTIAAPAFQLPRTTLDNYNTSPSAPPAQGLIDPNLATPYVQQWNISIQHEFAGNSVFEVRYVGNHTVKQYRVIDYNQVDVSRGGFIQDFIKARSNAQLALNATGTYNPAYNASIAGSQQIPFFATLANGGSLTNATISGLIRSGEAGTLAQTYQTNGFLPAGFSFFPNQYALYSALLTNLSNSTYNGLQTEFTRRMRGGSVVQASYTFSKSLSDAALTRGLEAQLDNSNGKIEKARTPFDTTHSFKLNHYTPLPLHANNAILRRAVTGWGLGGFLRVESGPPVTILSARGTLNRGARSGNNTADTSLTLSQLKDITGTFKTGNAVYWIDPSHIASNGTGVAPDGTPAFAGQVFFNPQPGSLGSLQRRDLDGPGFFMYDFSAIKDTRLTERQSLQLRADFYNVFNHPSFFIGDQNVNSSTFGQITAQNYTNYNVGPRQVQLGLTYSF